MSVPSSDTPVDPKQKEPGITAITVAGFKSIRDEQTIEIRPLTILAGANSSGKSSIMQPLLLLKQTLEADFDPGPLLLNGPNVRFTEAEQLLSRTLGGGPAKELQVGLRFGRGDSVVSHFAPRRQDSGIEVVRTTWSQGDESYSITPGMSGEEIVAEIPDRLIRQAAKLWGPKAESLLWGVKRSRSFLCLTVAAMRGVGDRPTDSYLHAQYDPAELPQHIRRMIHVAGLRGHPERKYGTAAVGETFPGTFQVYTANVIAKWQSENETRRLNALIEDLRVLGLSWKVEAKRVSDAEVELRVGRLPSAAVDGADDLVSIADVGFGVSQTLPVLVALHVATPEHLVYVEQPEIHLHPRAQVAMARVLARAVKRGVRMVVETHSPLLLLAVQALVAEGSEDLSPEMVKLHWFTRSEEDGTTTISTADLDQAGAFGDWPEDFGDVELGIEKRYLDAAEARMSSK